MKEGIDFTSEEHRRLRTFTTREHFTPGMTFRQVSLTMLDNALLRIAAIGEDALPPEFAVPLHELMLACAAQMLSLAQDGMVLEPQQSAWATRMLDEANLSVVMQQVARPERPDVH